MKTRGFACIALDGPRDSVNVSGALRAAHAYGAVMVVVRGTAFKNHKVNTSKAHRHLPLLMTGDVFNGLPHGTIPVAVDLVDGAVPLPDYVHPERAFYIFGAENATLGDHILDRCRDRVTVPTSFCMNLAASINVVLYDRLAKRSFSED